MKVEKRLTIDDEVLVYSNMSCSEGFTVYETASTSAKREDNETGCFYLIRDSDNEIICKFEIETDGGPYDTSTFGDMTMSVNIK